MPGTETHLTDVGRRLTLAAGVSQGRDGPRSSCSPWSSVGTIRNWMVTLELDELLRA